ncbi:hypothetical protein AB1Y20_004472 [Prymnesium parvum]|uniref:Checkpoint protein n=1 Tax=Prymnesium parvum TaxID=97485 RepID=A0AB34IYV7_PRYPA
MAPPVFFTAARVVECPPPPGVAGALERWLSDTFGEALFVTQQGRYLRFVRTTPSGGGEAAIIAAKSKEPAAEDEVVVSMAALRDTSVAPCIEKVFLALFHTTIQGTHGEISITAKRAKAEGESIAKIVVERTPALGTGTVRATQSTLTVQSFLSQVAHKLTAVHLELPRVEVEQVAGGTPAVLRDVVSWAAFPKLVDLARAADVFQSAAPTLTWEDAEEFLTAAMRRPVSGKPAVISAAARLNTKLTTRTEARTAIAAALDVARETSVELTMADKGEIVAVQGVPSTTTSPAARAPAEAARRQEVQPDPRPLALEASEDGSEPASSSGSSATSVAFWPLWLSRVRLSCLALSFR